MNEKWTGAHNRVIAEKVHKLDIRIEKLSNPPAVRWVVAENLNSICEEWQVSWDKGYSLPDFASDAHAVINAVDAWAKEPGRRRSWALERGSDGAYRARLMEWGEMSNHPESQSFHISRESAEDALAWALYKAVESL